MMCLSRRTEGCSASPATMLDSTAPTAKKRSAVAQIYDRPTCGGWGGVVVCVVGVGGSTRMVAAVVLARQDDEVDGCCQGAPEEAGSVPGKSGSPEDGRV